MSYHAAVMSDEYNPPAFPYDKCAVCMPEDMRDRVQEIHFQGQGMTLHDYFAGQALLTAEDLLFGSDDALAHYADVARAAYAVAAEMLKARAEMLKARAKEQQA